MKKYRTIVTDPPWPYEDVATPRQRAKGATSFLPYKTMTLRQIRETLCLVPAALDAHLYLWTTQRFLWDAHIVAQRSGFRVGQVLVWCKRPNGVGMGGAFAPTVEFCLFCRRNWGATLNLLRLQAGLTIADLHEAIRGGKPTGLVSMWMKGDRYPSNDDWNKLEALFGRSLLGPRAGLPKSCESSWFQWPRGKHSQKSDAFYDLVERVSPGPRLELFARRARLGWDYWGDESLQTVDLPLDAESAA